MTIKATTKPTESVNIDGNEMKFSKKNGSFMTKDPGLAREIEARYGKKGEVVPQETVTVPIYNAGREDGHHYTFTVPEMPWKKDKEKDNG